MSERKETNEVGSYNHWLSAWRHPLDSATGEGIQTEHGTPIQLRSQSSERLRGLEFV